MVSSTFNRYKFFHCLINVCLHCHYLLGSWSRCLRFHFCYAKYLVGLNHSGIGTQYSEPYLADLLFPVELKNDLKSYNILMCCRVDSRMTHRTNMDWAGVGA